MKKVTKYEADDGTLFDFRDQAIAHERLMKLKEWYNNENRLIGNYGDTICWDEFLEYIRNKHDKVLEILDACLTHSGENRSA